MSLLLGAYAFSLVAPALGVDHPTCSGSLCDQEIEGNALLHMTKELRLEQQNKKDGSAVNPVNASDYQQAYDVLYDAYGYHADPELTHANSVVTKFNELVQGLPQGVPRAKTVVDLGCSHGKGAEMLHALGYSAWGIDVAHKAVEMARAQRGNTCDAEADQPCFVQGSLTIMPYANNSFDAAVSSDVLEHIAPEDVPAVVSEISRVARRFLVVQIANFKELSKSGENAHMQNVHLTVEGPAWWAAAFARGGWKVVNDTSSETYVNLVMEK